MIYEYFCRSLLHRKQCIASNSTGPPMLSVLPLCLDAAPVCCSCIRDSRKGREMRNLAHRSTRNCTNLTLARVMQDLFLVFSRPGSVITHNIAKEDGNLMWISVCFKSFSVGFFFFWLKFTQVEYYVCLLVATRCPNIHEVCFEPVAFFWLTVELTVSD